MFRRFVLVLLVVAGGQAALRGQRIAPVHATLPQLSEADAREWLTYLSSDLLQGRQVFTEGYGLAADYIADHLHQWGLQPMGTDGTYLQAVYRRGYEVSRKSTLAVTIDGRTETFADGTHVSFSLLSGQNQTLTFDRLVIVGPETGDGTPSPDIAKSVRGQLVLALPASTSDVRDTRADELINIFGAAAVITVSPTPFAPAGGSAAGRGGRGRADLVTVRRIDALEPPSVAVDDTAFDALVSGSGAASDLRARAQRGEPFAPAALSGRTIRLQLDTTYTVLSTQRTENVVGMVPGTDPALRDTYVLFGAHLDHVGYRLSPPATGPDCRPAPPDDLIFNGADDDGSGSTALLGIAKALAAGPRPRRSIVLIWHAGEEAGLLGSQYMADHPVVPLDRIQAELNIDMIGRNRDDDPSRANTVYIIGDDRISTDLHNLIVDTNAVLPRPLTLDYEYNDPSDPNSFYTRSDHYSYASKGIPIAFFFTGTHPDYHCVTDQVERILFPKLIRVAQMVYETGYGLADSTQTLVRDNRGPRAGRGFQGRLGR
jgi:Zn-dependent M28 family amino/carboxypeptidase